MADRAPVAVPPPPPRICRRAPCPAPGERRGCAGKLGWGSFDRGPISDCSSDRTLGSNQGPWCQVPFLLSCRLDVTF